METRARNDNRTKNRKQSTGQARGNLMRQERDLGQAKGELKSATRNRIVGGVILLIGIFVLLQVNVAVGVVILLIGGWMFAKAFVKMGQEHRAIDRSTDRVTEASAKLAELEAQPPDAD